MKIISTIRELRTTLLELRRTGQRLALVPTMGNLHEGHMALVEAARQHADIVVVSIFVNPLQFDREEDLNNYPKTLQQDCQQLEQQQADVVFAPQIDEIYPDGTDTHTFVEEPVLSSLLDGAQRPGHFRGVTTVVSKLFNLVQPDIACFGEKDFQQLAIIRKLVKDMAYDIQIVSIPTVRTLDKLALSSRNNYLTAEERDRAPVLSSVMRLIAERIAQGENDYAVLISDAEQQLRQENVEPDGLAICDAETLQAVSETTNVAVILMAAWLGKARLIDNMTVELPTSTPT